MFDKERKRTFLSCLNLKQKNTKAALSLLSIHYDHKKTKKSKSSHLCWNMKRRLRDNNVSNAKNLIQISVHNILPTSGLNKLIKGSLFNLNFDPVSEHNRTVNITCIVYEMVDVGDHGEVRRTTQPFRKLEPSLPTIVQSLERSTFG